MSDLENRVLVMERRLHEMQADLVAARNQFVPQNSPRRVRIAKVTQQPSSSGDKKFGVVFLNGDFTETMSPETASFTDRSNETYQKVAYNLGSKNPANGDRVFCFEVGDRWWFRLEEGGTTIGTTVPEETMHCYGARYWFTTDGAEYHAGETEGRGTHINKNDPTHGLRTTFHLSWTYIHNPQSWFSIGTSDPWNIRISESGLYRISVTVLSKPYMIYTGSPVPPDPPDAFAHLISFQTIPFSTCGEDWIYGLPHVIYSQQYYTSSDFGASFTCPDDGICQDARNCMTRLKSSRSGLIVVPATPGYKEFSIKSVLAADSLDTEWGLQVLDIELEITRIADDEQWGSCPVAIP